MALKKQKRMIIYNTTFHLDDEIHDLCLQYLRKEYIPSALKNELLHTPVLALIHPQHEESGTSYSLQFRAKDMDALEIWVEGVGQDLQEELSLRFGTKACGFMTLLEEMEI